MSKKSKTKAKLKTKTKAKKAAKVAAHGKKTLKKTAKPKPKSSTKGKTSMAGKKDDEERREKSKAGEIDTGTNEHPALRPDGAEYEEDPMAPPPDGPLSPSEAARVDQGGEVDLSGSPGSAGEHVPVIEPSREHEPGTTHENRPPREDSNPQETAARTAQHQSQQGGDPKAYRAPKDTK